MEFDVQKLRGVFEVCCSFALRPPYSKTEILVKLLFEVHSLL